MKCIICGKEIKEDHVYCLECYMNFSKSDALKKCKEYYLENQKEIILCYDNYNHSMKYFDKAIYLEKYLEIVDLSKHKIEKKPSAGDDKLLDYLNEKKEIFDKLNLKMEYSSLMHLDTLWILKQVLSKINEKVKREMTIYMEYSLPNLEKQRIDYIFLHNNKMIILEFSQSDTIALSTLSKTKTKQLNKYKRVLKKEYPELKNKNIITEVFVYQSNQYSVNKSIEHLVKMIEIHFIDRKVKDILNSIR